MSTKPINTPSAYSNPQWEATLSFEDAIESLNEYSQFNFEQYANENDFGLFNNRKTSSTSVTTTSVSPSTSLNDSNNSDYCEELSNKDLATLSTDPHTKLNTSTVVKRNIKQNIDQKLNEPMRTTENILNGIVDDSEITMLLRQNGVDPVNNELKLNSAKTRKHAPFADSRLPVNGLNNVFITDEFFEFPGMADNNNICNTELAKNAENTQNQLDVNSNGKKFYSPRELYNLKRKSKK